MRKVKFLRKRKPAPALVFNTVISASLLAILSVGVRGRPVSGLERDLFNLINGLPGVLVPPLVVVMQAGAYASILGAAFIALLLRRKRLAVELLIAGNAAYWLAVLCKVLVARQRPGQLLEHIRIYGPIGGIWGYPSGHVAVATALSFMATRALPKRFRRYLWLVLGTVAVARIAVGAHLPIDVVGGFLVGWLAVCLTRLVVGERNRARSLMHVRAVLRERGTQLTELRHLPGNARGSVPAYAKTTTGQELFVKATSNEQRDADWLYKLYRRAVYRHIEDEAPFITAKQKSEHEAYLSLLAHRAEVRTPRLITTAVDEDGNSFLVTEFIDGRPLDQLPARRLDDRALTEIWSQLARLHRAGIAHRDLRGANVLLRDSDAFLVDLSFAEANATREQQAQDVVQLLVSTSARTSPEASITAARTTVGCDALTASLPYLQRAALSRAARNALSGHPKLLDDLRSEIMRQCGARPVKPVRFARFSRRNIVILIMLGLAVHFFLPQLGEVRTAVRHLVRANPLWLSLSLLAAAATYVASAVVFRTAARAGFSLRLSLLLQVAASFANRLAPGSLGSAGLGVRFLQKQGMSVVAAATVVAIIRLSGTVSTLVLLPFLLLSARHARVHIVRVPTGLTVLLVAVGALVAVAAVLAVPRLRRLGRSVLGQLLAGMRAFLRSGKAPLLVAQHTALSLAYGACLYFALLAVGVSPSIPHVLLVYFAGSSLSSAAPTPGGLGAEEVALVAGLVVFGTPTEAAIAGVLIYRLMSFWLPMVPGFVALQRLTAKEYV